MTSPLNFDKVIFGSLDFSGQGPKTVELWVAEEDAGEAGGIEVLSAEFS